MRGRYPPGKLTFPLILVASLLLYCGASVHHHFVNIEAPLVSAKCSLGEISDEVRKFHIKNHRYPTSFEDMGVRPEDYMDSVSRKPWKWNIPAAQSSVIVCQPEPYRTWLWPFGEWERYGLLTDGTVRKIEPFFDTK